MTSYNNDGRTSPWLKCELVDDQAGRARIIRVDGLHRSLDVGLIILAMKRAGKSSPTKSRVLEPKDAIPVWSKQWVDRLLEGAQSWQ